jgi:hypothetical protein
MKSGAVLLLCAVGLGGCFSYADIPPASAPPQASAVRVRLSRPMDFPISDVTVRDVVQLDGEVVEVRDTAMRLSVFGLRSQTGFGVPANGETVLFPRTAVVELQQKRISPLRSGLVAALIVALGFAVKESGVVTGSGGNPGGGGGSSK